MQQLFAYEYLANMLKEYDVSHVFHMEAMLRLSLREMENLGITPILAHSEAGAGYMADGYARITGKPGICLAQSVGAANMAGAIMDAYLACSPVIVMTGKKLPFQQHRNAYQESDHRLFFEAITKFNACVDTPEQLPYLIRQCFRAATTGKPRPVHLDIPNRMGRTTEKAAVPEDLLIDPMYKRCPAFRPGADEASLIEASSALATARKPILVIGRGVLISEAGGAIKDLAVKASIPMAATPDGKTAVDENHELWIGICGDYGMNCANRAIAEADLVIYFGSQISDQTTLNWQCPLPGTKIIQVDIEPSELGRNYPNTIALLGDAGTVARQLTELIPAQDRAEWCTVLRTYYQETCRDYEKRFLAISPKLRPDRLCAEIGRVLPDNAVIVSDTGYSAIWTATMMRLKTTQKYLRSAGTLGWAFPASLGVKCGAPDRPVLCFTGDGGFYYHLSEMETAARYGIRTVTIVNNNNALGQCVPDLQTVFTDSEQCARRYEFTPVNFTKIAAEMGFYAQRVTEAQEVAAALQSAFASSKPALIEAITDVETPIPQPK